MSGIAVQIAKKMGPIKLNSPFPVGNNKTKNNQNNVGQNKKPIANPKERDVFFNFNPFWTFGRYVVMQRNVLKYFQGELIQLE